MLIKILKLKIKIIVSTVKFECNYGIAKNITLRTFSITSTFEAIITNVGKINPRIIRNQLYATPENCGANQFGAQLKQNKKRHSFAIF